MPLRLRVVPPSSRQPGASAGAPDGAAERLVVFDDGVGQIRIGRRADLELSLPFSPLSGVHARLVRASDSTDKADHWLLEDLGSTNGTFVAGERLKPGVKLAVRPGMEIKVAEISLIFDGDVRAKGEAEAAAPAPSPSKTTGKVQAEASSKVTGKVAGDGSNKVSSKAPGDGSNKVSGKVEGEASNKVTSKTVSEVSSKSGGGKLPGNDPTQTYVRRQFTDVFAAGPSLAQVPVLTAVAGITDGDTTFRLEQRDHIYMFGRTRRCEFRVSGPDVSREHASFERRGDGIYVNDLGSVNGVLVNNTRVKEYRLYDGDLIHVGHVKLRLFDPSERSPRESDRRPASSPLSRSTPSQSVPSQFGAPPPMHGHAHAPPEPLPRAYEPPPGSDASAAFRSELHPAVAGQLAAEGGTYRRRPSVRVRIQESWETTSSSFRYGIVIVACSILAVCAVIVGFSLAG